MKGSKCGRLEKLFDYITGRLSFIDPAFIVVENNGIGYSIITANPFSYTNQLDTEVCIYTYLHVREDQFVYYGFSTRQERALFQKLLDVTGIGPKGALAILAYGQPEQVITAIEEEDEAFLVKFPGIGKKTARQIILDLKGKLQHIVPDYFPNLFTIDKIETARQANEQLEDAKEALKALGYSDKEIKKITPILEKEQLSTDGYIKLALKYFIR